MTSQPFGGRERAYATPRETHGSSWRLVRRPSPSTRSQLFISTSRISNGWVCGRAHSRASWLGSTRAISPPRLLAPTSPIPPVTVTRSAELSASSRVRRQPSTCWSQAMDGILGTDKLDPPSGTRGRGAHRWRKPVRRVNARHAQLESSVRSSGEQAWFDARMSQHGAVRCLEGGSRGAAGRGSRCGCSWQVGPG